MRKYTLLAVSVICFSMLSTASGATLSIQVKTDQEAYNVGDTVTWTIYAWAVSSADNHGIAALSANLNDNTGETLQTPFLVNGEFLDTFYGTEERFQVIAAGTSANTPPHLRDMAVMQMPFAKVFDIGNNNDPCNILAKGQYMLSRTGEHALEVSSNGANYWPDDINNAMPFEAINAISTSFMVYLKSDFNKDGDIDVFDIVIMVQEWLQESDNLITDIVPEAGDGIVNMYDFTYFASEWLLYFE